MAPSTPTPAALHPYQRDGHWWYDCLTCELTCGPYGTRDDADHDFHLVPTNCEWCARKKQPLLCTRCYSVEKQREENTPLAPGEKEAAEVFVALVGNNGRLAAQAEADRTTCKGIAKATEEA